MRSFKILCTFAFICMFVVGSLLAFAQSGKGTGSGRRGETLNVIVHAPEGAKISKDDVDLYDSGIAQEVETFNKVDAGSRIVLMIDDSSNLRVESEVLQKTIAAVINELYEDDQMMIVAYNEEADILVDMTPDSKAMQGAFAKMHRKGFPNLFEGLVAVSDALVHQAKTGVEKRAIILISDGYDSESKTKFDDALRTLQEENILLYAIKVPDRTHGALIKDKPKPAIALERLTSGTGGKIFPIDKGEEAAKTIADDLRKNWYRLTYSPAGVNPINLRRLILMSRHKEVEFRTKDSHPPKYH